MSRLKRSHKNAFHSTQSGSSSTKLAKTSAPTVSQTQPTKADLEREPLHQELGTGSLRIQPIGDRSEDLPQCSRNNIISQHLIAQSNADSSGHIEVVPVLPGRVLPPDQTQSTLSLQTAVELQSPAAEYANIDAPRNALDSNRTGQPKVSFYENASHFTVYNPIMGDNIQITQIQTSNGAVLKEMVEHTMPGAQYDSSARDSPPRCHPGTRTRILEDIQARIHAHDTATRMVWIYGPAGVGKSAIMQTLAEAEASRGATFTTLFFSRPNERDDPKKTFTTLAYGLALRNLEYRRYIGEKLADDPTFLAKSMDEQFQQLFITPFLTPVTKNHVGFNSQRWVIFLDGLDECRGEAGQRRIMELIRKSMLHCTLSTPFIWVIASRPEVHLKAQFAKAKTNIEGFYKLEVPIDSDDSLRDVERYLHSQFSDMCESNPDSIPPLWPSESDFLRVSKASSGLFIFASTLIAYLLGGDPVSRLKHVISFIIAAGTQAVNPQRNPFQILDFLYTQIMSDVPEEVLSTTKLLLGFYLLPVSRDREGIPFLRASNILELEQYRAYAALCKLHSVLDCPPPQEAAKRPIRFLHASFSDFLLDPSRSKTYSIDSNKETAKVWQCCTKILHQYELHHAHTYVNLSWSPHDVDPDVLQEGVWQDAQELWMQVLLTSQTGARQDWFLNDDPSLIQTLRRLGPTIFRTTRGPGLTVAHFLDWLDCDASSEVRSNFLLETFDLGHLNTDKLFKSLCAQHWCYRIFDSGEFCFSDVNLVSIARYDDSEWVQAKNALWNESSVLRDLALRSNRRANSHVLNFGGTRQCVVTGPIPDPQGLVYYILPYFDEHSG